MKPAHLSTPSLISYLSQKSNEMNQCINDNANKLKLLSLLIAFTDHTPMYERLQKRIFSLLSEIYSHPEQDDESFGDGGKGCTYL